MTCARADELFHAIPQRQCTKTVYDGSLLPSVQLTRLEHIGQGAGVKTIMLTTRAQLDAVTEYVTRGNAAQLTDTAFRQELVSSIRFNPSAAQRCARAMVFPAVLAGSPLCRHGWRS